MMSRAESLLHEVVVWAEAKPDIDGVVLVGFYTRGEARRDSDVGLVILTPKRNDYVDKAGWAIRFGQVTGAQAWSGKLRTTAIIEGSLRVAPSQPDVGPDLTDRKSVV